jgi:hypothetical protein
MVTIKQKRAFKKVVEGSSLTQAMKDVGYSLETAKRTNKLTETDGWNELMNKYLPDDDLAKAHKQGLKADIPTINGTRPDYSTRHKYLETAYKIKNKFPKEGGAIVPIQININEDREKYAS